MQDPRQPPGALAVHFQGRQEAVLRPGDPAFTFGRGDDRTLRFGHDTVHGGPDRHISRHAGSIRYAGGWWVVCNDSDGRPFDVIVRGVANPLPPRTASGSRWAVTPPGLEIRVCSPIGRYQLSVSIDAPRPPVTDPPKQDESTTTEKLQPTPHERLLLAAKFLSLPDPGEAIGNREAAEYASAARPRDKLVTERAVEDCVGRWCRKLKNLGVTGIDGRGNINQLGRQLLAWRVLHEEDRKLLRPGAGTSIG
ncbi:MAG: hypothetical protein ACRDRP_24720 [Pseudonocardiaceae bacterium]